MSPLIIIFLIVSLAILGIVFYTKNMNSYTPRIRGPRVDKNDYGKKDKDGTKRSIAERL